MCVCVCVCVCVCDGCRLKGCSSTVEVWQRILAVHSMVLPHQANEAVWLKFASLCRKSGRLRISEKILQRF